MQQGSVIPAVRVNNFIYDKPGLGLSEREEGFSLTAYPDIKGVWTIGYGHTGPEVIEGLVWTQEQAENAFAADITWASNAVNHLVTFPLNQSEFDALVDLVFNIGAPVFAKSTLLRLLNEGNIHAAAAQFEEWDHAGGKVVAGLLRRRIDETREFEQVAS